MQFTQEEKASHLKQWEQSGLSELMPFKHNTFV